MFGLFGFHIREIMLHHALTRKLHNCFLALSTCDARSDWSAHQPMMGKLNAWHI